MTAFEILLNKFYDTIEQNEPEKSHATNMHTAKELYSLTRKFIDTSFFHGHNLRYKNVLSNLLEQSAGIMRKSNHEEWSRIRFAFLENELHTIKRDRAKEDIANLKMKLDRVF